MAILFNEEGKTRYVKIDKQSTYLTPNGINVGFIYYPSEEERNKTKQRELEFVEFNKLYSAYMLTETAYFDVLKEEVEYTDLSDEDKARHLKYAQISDAGEYVNQFIQIYEQDLHNIERLEKIESIKSRFECIEEFGYKEEWITDPIVITATGDGTLFSYEDYKEMAGDNDLLGETALYTAFKNFHGDRCIKDLD